MEASTLAQIIGNNLKWYRSEYGMTQKEFANKIGMNMQNYSQTERGLYKPSLDKLMEIAKEINVSPNQLLLERTNDKVIKDKFEDTQYRIDFIKSRMNAFEPMRKKAYDAKKMGDTEEEEKCLLDIIMQLMNTNEQRWDVADYLYYKSLNEEILKASKSYQDILNETTIDKLKKYLKNNSF